MQHGKYPRLHLERLQAYAPQLNPIEAAWHAVTPDQRPTNDIDGCAFLNWTLHYLRGAQ
jgi:hypothetical protein